jgi:hypothetical protein
MKIIEAREVVAGIIVAVNFLQKMKGRHSSSKQISQNVVEAKSSRGWRTDRSG